MRLKTCIRMLSALLMLSVAAVFGLREAVAADIYARHAHTDPGSGKVFFNVLRGSPAVQLVVFRTAEGEWMRLPDMVRNVGYDAGSGCIRVSSYSLMPLPFADACYDAAKDELVYTTLYEPSPSGKWGLKTIIFYEPYDLSEQQTGWPHSLIHYGSHTLQKKETLLLKNNVTGEIRQLVRSSKYPVHRWLADGTLLLQQFSETDRQNELVRIHPATGEMKRLLPGSLYGYNAEHNLLLYVINEPSRRLRIYDFRTGESRLAKEGEAALFYPETDVPREVGEAPSLPEDLDIDALPVAHPEIRYDHAAVMTLDGSEVPLPFAFVGLDGETYVPLRPLIDRGWTLRQEPLDRGFEYVVETGRGSFRLNRTNSISLNDRLYVPIRLIESLGHEAELKWQP
jgi:hypothetical protein